MDEVGSGWQPESEEKLAEQAAFAAAVFVFVDEDGFDIVAAFQLTGEMIDELPVATCRETVDDFCLSRVRLRELAGKEVTFRGVAGLAVVVPADDETVAVQGEDGIAQGYEVGFHKR